MSDGESPPPPSEAVAAARAYARVAGDAEDGVLAGVTASAIALAEAFIGTALLTRTCEQIVVGDGAWHRLALAPVSAIDAPELAADGAALAVDRYRIDIGADGRGWVRLAAGSGPARVRYTAGLAVDWAGMPAPIAQGVAMLAAHLFNAGEGARAADGGERALAAVAEDAAVTGAADAVQTAAVAALAAALDGVAVFDAPPVRAVPPFAVVEDPAVTDWSAAGLDGRELRLALTITDAGERPVRLRALMAAAEAALVLLSGEIGGGWRVASVLLARNRIVRTGERWRATSEWRVRVARPVAIGGDE